MKVYYVDEYGITIYENDNVTILPKQKDLIVVHDEDFLVKDIVWELSNDRIIVNVTQTQEKIQVQESEDVRLAQVNNAILKLNKRVEATEKKNFILNEELVSVRTHIRKQDKKIGQ